MSGGREQWIDGWVELGERLRAHDGDDFDDVVETVREIVEARELMALHDHLIPLRARRPVKRYSA